MDLQYLREATRSEHEATEAAMPLLGPELTRADYAHVLGCLLPILESWEVWAEVHAPARLRPLLKPRRRTHLLLADLQLLEAEGAPKSVASTKVGPPDWSSIVQQPSTAAGERTEAEREARFLGALYVFEGSTLGGRFLARQVETALVLQPGQGNTYFQGHGAATGSLWREITAEIAAVPNEFAGQLVSTARCTFAAFRQALAGGGQPRLETDVTGSPLGTNTSVGRTRTGHEASKLS